MNLGSVNNFSQERRRNRAESNSYLNVTVGPLDMPTSPIIGWHGCYLHQHPCRAATQVPPFTLHDRALTSGICAAQKKPIAVAVTLESDRCSQWNIATVAVFERRRRCVCCDSTPTFTRPSQRRTCSGKGSA